MANEQNLKPFTGKNDPRNGVKPKGAKHISTWINELLNDETFTATIQQGLKVVEYKGAPIKAIIQAQTRLAINGDTKAADVLFKHGVVQKLLLGNDPDNPLNPTRELTDEELRARYQQIIASQQGGIVSDSLGTGSPPSAD